MNTTKAKVSRCPTCGRTGMQRHKLDVSVDGGKHVVPGVEVDVCPHCNEQLYDSKAMRMIEQSYPPRRQRRRKAM